MNSLNKEEEKIKVAREEQEQRYMSNYIKKGKIENLKSEFSNYVEQGITFIPTGFAKLDKILGGGLPIGLTIIGAVSSLGKTTFCLQIAEQMARMGQDVFFFSMEMSKFVLMSKGVSKIAHDKGYRFTAQQVINNEMDKDKLQECLNDYPNNIYILEGEYNTSANSINDVIKEYLKEHEKAPVIMVDYLQILGSENVNATDKQKCDENVTTLKNLAVKYNTSVVAISSLNRASYQEEISMSAFKESGAIEYTSELLLGLQLNGVGSKGFNENEAKAREIRDVELVILKNRMGATGEKIPYKFASAYNIFKEY